MAILGMPRGKGSELAEIFQIFKSQTVPGQIEERIQKGRAVSRRKNESVPVDPIRLKRIVLR